jgi:hypothetical protein
LSYEAFGRDTPGMKAIASEAETIRHNRKPAADDNPFLKMQQAFSKGIVSALDKWRDMQELVSEQLFLAVYGSPALQTAVGVAADSDPSPLPEMSEEHRRRVEARIVELKAKIGDGGLRECWIRALLYVGMTRGMVDERSLEALRRMRRDDEASRLTLAAFKTLVREQFYMLILDQNASLAAIPKMLPEEVDLRRRAFAAIRDVLSVARDVSGDTATRLKRIGELFGIGDGALEASGDAFSPRAKAS